jgi:hypothetical protein
MFGLIGEDTGVLVEASDQPGVEQRLGVKGAALPWFGACEGSATMLRGSTVTIGGVDA